MKKPLIVFSTDWHLKPENIVAIKALVKQQCELAIELGVDYIACTGDVYDSRIAQREDTLTAFDQILDIVDGYGLELWLIPGNHDKTIYSSKESFLTPNKHHPCLKLISLAGSLPFKEYGIQLHFLPFFQEDVWIKKFDELCEYIEDFPTEEKHILCTHIAVTGSKNNDGTLVSSSISPTKFSHFFKVFSGHYHDQQRIGKNFYHIPSIQQNNFGEDSDKGFTVLFSDGSHELVKSKFKEFVKVSIDLDLTTQDKLEELKRQYKESDDNVRFVFTGSENVLKSLNKSDFNEIGIEVKTQVREIINDIEFSETEEVVEHTASTIKEEFVKFADKEKLNVEKGLNYLTKKLNGSK